MENNGGYFGEFGGRFVPPALEESLKELETAFYKYIEDPEFQAELQKLYKEYAGRESLLYYAERLTNQMGGAKIYLKREDLNHTGAHKINNALGQILLAKKMGKKRIIAETGAGSHGVATATVCAYFGLECIIYMGEVDIKRQALNVFRMELLGAKVVSVTRGTKSLKDAVDAALEDYVANTENTFYLLGSAVGPHPYPTMVREFQSVIGKEARAQILEKEGRLPDYVIACIGGGSNAIGLFHPFLNDKGVHIVGAEPAGYGLDTPDHAASISKGRIEPFMDLSVTLYKMMSIIHFQFTRLQLDLTIPVWVLSIALSMKVVVVSTMQSLTKRHWKDFSLFLVQKESFRRLKVPMRFMKQCA